MAKISTKQYAKALFDATEGKSEKEVDEVTKAFAQILHERQELHRAQEIARVFKSIWKRVYGVSEVRVETAEPISETMLKELKKRYAKADIVHEVNDSLIGGAIVQIDDTRIDSTISGALTQLKQTLSR